MLILQGGGVCVEVEVVYPRVQSGLGGALSRAGTSEARSSDTDLQLQDPVGVDLY